MQPFNEIDNVKGIAMLTVLWHHSFILYPIYMLDIPWCQHARAINMTFITNVLFLLSGYLFAFSKKQSMVEILKSNVIRLLVPYLSFSVVTLGMKLIAPTLVNKKVEYVGSFMESLILRGGELWFVYVLFILFLIWPRILRHCTGKHIWGIVAVLIMADILIPRGLMTDKDMNTTTERALRSFEADKSFKFDNGSVRLCDAYQADKVTIHRH